tara:strand:+ start:1045 stop:1155 length:111 start_codon:yes stop_codon:yes gene_type:complete
MATDKHISRSDRKRGDARLEEENEHVLPSLVKTDAQ